MTTVNAIISTVGTTHQQQPSTSRNKNKNKLPPQQELTSGKSQQVASKIELGTQLKTNEVLNLKERAFCLSLESEKKFQIAIKNAIFFLNGFVATIKGDNLDYKSDEANLSSEKVAIYKEIQERDHKNYVDTASRTDDLKIAIQMRITALEQAALKANFESALLTQACVGKESNFVTTFLALDYKYGIPYRLSEARQALDARNKKLQCQETDLQTTKEGLNQPSEELQGLNTLLAKTVALKEVVTVYNETFKDERFAALKKQVYFAHLHFLLEFEKEFYEKKNAITQRLEQLNTAIERESLNRDSLLLPVLKFEKLAIEDSATRMKLRLREIAKFLDAYKVNESEKPSEIKIEVLSGEHEQVMNLLKRIASFKENVLRDNVAEVELSIEQRKHLYSNSSHKLATITTTVTEVKQSYEGRVKVLDAQARDYLTAIEKLKSGISQLQEALNKTVDATKERLQWKLETEVKSEVETVQQETQSFFSYFTSWRKASATDVRTVMPPTSPVTNATSTLTSKGMNSDESIGEKTLV